MVEDQIDILKLLQSFALGVMIAGALGSLYLTVSAGENNKSFLLVLLFILWVLSPFAALIRINILSGPWPNTPRISLYIFMLVVSAASLALYSGIYRIQGVKNAFPFLATPLVTWLLMAIGFFVFRIRKYFHAGK